MKVFALPRGSRGAARGRHASSVLRRWHVVILQTIGIVIVGENRDGQKIAIFKGGELAAVL